MSYTFKFYGGNTGCTFSKIWGRNITLTEEIINGYDSTSYIPKFDNDTYMMTKFTNDLQAGNVTTLIGNLQNWLLYRLKEDDSTLELVSIIDINQNEFYDYNVLNESVYEYYLFLESDIVITNPVITNSVQSLYYGWFIIDLENSKSYQLDIEFGGANRNHMEDFTEYDTNQIANTFTRGGNHYIEGNITSILSNNNLKQDIVNTNDLLSEFRSFIKNDKPKLLKSRRNKSYLVMPLDYREELLSSSIAENVYKVSFKFKEVGDV